MPSRRRHIVLLTQTEIDMVLTSARYKMQSYIEREHSNHVVNEVQSFKIESQVVLLTVNVLSKMKGTREVIKCPCIIYHEFLFKCTVFFNTS